MAHGGGGSERWLLTYSDLITLLLAFFIILYAMSKVDEGKYTKLAQSLSVALGTYNVPENDAGGNSVVKPLSETEQFQEVIKDVQVYLEGNGQVGSVSMTITERGLVISINASVFFHTADAELTAEAKKMLDQVAAILKQVPNQIRVEGHTDNLPINSAKYPSNWQLSTDRATNVLVYLVQKHGYNPAMLSAAGYGEYRPVAANSSPQGRAKNRRVDLVVLRSKFAEAEPEPVADEHASGIPATAKPVVTG